MKAIAIYALSLYGVLSACSAGIGASMDDSISQNIEPLTCTKDEWWGHGGYHDQMDGYFDLKGTPESSMVVEDSIDGFAVKVLLQRMQNRPNVIDAEVWGLDVEITSDPGESLDFDDFEVSVRPLGCKEYKNFELDEPISSVNSMGNGDTWSWRSESYEFRPNPNGGAAYGMQPFLLEVRKSKVLADDVLKVVVVSPSEVRDTLRFEVSTDSDIWNDSEVPWTEYSGNDLYGSKPGYPLRTWRLRSYEKAVKFSAVWANGVQRFVRSAVTFPATSFVESEGFLVSVGGNTEFQDRLVEADEIAFGSRDDKSINFLLSTLDREDAVSSKRVQLISGIPHLERTAYTRSDLTKDHTEAGFAPLTQTSLEESIDYEYEYEYGQGYRYMIDVVKVDDFGIEMSFY